jgi:endonuclease/exonuclease/phosphatase family metal-dependent hydrolase
VIGQAQGFVHGDYAATGWGPHPRARNAHVLRLFDHAAERTVTVAHMHGLRDPAGKADTDARCAQAERFAAMIRQTRQPGDAVIACGDFNVLPGSVTLRRLGDLGLTDLVTGRGHIDTRTSHYRKEPRHYRKEPRHYRKEPRHYRKEPRHYRKEPRYADYLLVNDRVRVDGFAVVAEPEVSDHSPLVLDFVPVHFAVRGQDRPEAV